jgi:hypothetical protein
MPSAGGEKPPTVSAKNILLFFGNALFSISLCILESSAYNKKLFYNNSFLALENIFPLNTG